MIIEEVTYNFSFQVIKYFIYFYFIECMHYYVNQNLGFGHIIQTASRRYLQIQFTATYIMKHDYGVEPVTMCLSYPRPPVQHCC